MTEIGMRVARALGKRNLTNPKMSLEKVAEVIDDVAQIQLLLDALSQMTALELMDIITSKAARNADTF